MGEKVSNLNTKIDDIANRNINDSFVIDYLSNEFSKYIELDG